MKSPETASKRTSEREKRLKTERRRRQLEEGRKNKVERRRTNVASLNSPPTYNNSILVSSSTAIKYSTANGAGKAYEERAREERKCRREDDNASGRQL